MPRGRDVRSRWSWALGLLAVAAGLVAMWALLGRRPAPEPPRPAISGLETPLLTVVGLSDEVPIREAPGSSRVVATMAPLQPYFVLEVVRDSYRISGRRPEGSVEGYVSSREVSWWNTREGLHFEPDALSRDRRPSVLAWESEDSIRRYAETGDLDAHGPAYREGPLDAGSGAVTPYPVLDSREVAALGGQTRRIHQVLIPALVEPGAPLQDAGSAATAVTLCIVFDAAGGMAPYARDLAATIDGILEQATVDARRAAAGFVLFRGPDAEPRFEVADPMPLAEAAGWLRQKADWLRQQAGQTIGGSEAARPVLDAVVLARSACRWHTASLGARRILIVAAGEDVGSRTLGLGEGIPPGLGAARVARLLIRSGVSVLALPAGPRNRGLNDVLATLASETGGELYARAAGPDRIDKSFAANLEALLSRPGQDSPAAADPGSGIPSRNGGEALVALNVLDAGVTEGFEAAAEVFGIPRGRLFVTRAWVFEQQDLYRRQILIGREQLEWLVRFFDLLTDSGLRPASRQRRLAGLLEEALGREVDPDVELQGLLERHLGLRFTSNLLSFELRHLAALDPGERLRLQARIRDATTGLEDFLEIHADRFAAETRIWMPESYLP